MNILMNVLSLLTAFGLGSIVTTLVQSWLSQKSKRDDRSFSEKQVAYVGLLEAYRRAAVENTDEAQKQFAYWQVRCELVAPKQLREAIQRLIDTDGDRAGRKKADADMRSAMRADLGITE